MRELELGPASDQRARGIGWDRCLIVDIAGQTPRDLVAEHLDMTDLRSAILPVEGFDELLQESLAEGSDMLRRLIDDWEADRNRFSRPGERLLSAHARGRLVGICGRNIDPYAEGPRTGRVRHLYVRREARRQGVGRDLLRAIIADADAHFDKLHVRAPAAAFSFYRAMGFERIDRDAFATHQMTFVF